MHTNPSWQEGGNRKGCLKEIASRIKDYWLIRELGVIIGVLLLSVRTEQGRGCQTQGEGSLPKGIFFICFWNLERSDAVISGLTGWQLRKESWVLSTMQWLLHINTKIVKNVFFMARSFISWKKKGKKNKLIVAPLKDSMGPEVVDMSLGCLFIHSHLVHRFVDSPSLFLFTDYHIYWNLSLNVCSLGKKHDFIIPFIYLNFNLLLAEWFTVFNP